MPVGHVLTERKSWLSSPVTLCRLQDSRPSWPLMSCRCTLIKKRGGRGGCAASQQVNKSRSRDSSGLIITVGLIEPLGVINTAAKSPAPPWVNMWVFDTSLPTLKCLSFVEEEEEEEEFDFSCSPLHFGPDVVNICLYLDFYTVVFKRPLRLVRQSYNTHRVKGEETAWKSRTPWESRVHAHARVSFPQRPFSSLA